MVVNVDTDPQPYFVLERTAVEASQQFATVREVAAPVQVPHIGLDAYWYADAQQFQTTDGVRLITVTVSGVGAAARQERLAIAAARPYLGKLVPPPGFQG